MKQYILNKCQNSTILQSFKRILVVLVLGFVSASASAQLVAQPGLSYTGQYDITMIAAPVLQLVWVKDESPLVMDRPFTDAEMLQCGKYLSLNNETSGTNNSVFRTGSMNSKAQPFVPAGDDGIAMIYADCDDDMSTFQSSAAYLDFGSDMSCTTVEAAYLYWVGNDDGGTTTYAAYPGTPTLKSHAGGATGVSTGSNVVKFKAAGDLVYTDVTADRTLANTPGDKYAYFADVTALVQGKPGGLYWCANVRNNGYDDGGGSKGGWNLVVIFRPPNCPPRVIKFWDGWRDDAGGDSVGFNFAAGEVPATSNSVSYLGVCTVDAEDNAGILADAGVTVTPANSGIQFTSSPGGTTQYINPLITDQAGFDVYDQNGVLHTDVHEGMASGRITTYDKFTGLNGNEITRLPSQINTLGFGAHHLRLPTGAMVASATSATMELPDEQNGSFSYYMTYMAIETQQPRLVMNKTSTVTTTPVGGVITYRLGISNIGNYITQPGAYVLDTLDLPVDYIPGSVEFRNKNGTIITPPTATEEFNVGSDVNEYVKFYLPQLTAANLSGVAQDSVVITFDVQVRDISYVDIWITGCRRTIHNRATAYYTSLDGDAFSTGSNASSGCPGAGQDADVAVDDASIQAAFNGQYFGTYDISGIPPPNVMTRFRADLQGKGLTGAEAAMYTITDEGNNPITAGLTFNPAYTSQTFYGTLDLGYGCIETYTFTYTSVILPEIVSVTPTDNSCSGIPDGTLTILVTKGDDGVNCKVYDILDMVNPVFETMTPPGEVDWTHVVADLPGGDYVVHLLDQYGAIVDSETATIIEPNPLTLALTADNTSICAGDAVNLTATAGGGTPPFDFVWKSSPDSTVWTVEAGPTSGLNTFADSPAITTYYKAYACDGGCSIVDGIRITVDTIPVAVIASNNGPICSGDNAVFTLSGTADAVVTYTVNAGGNTTLTLDGTGAGTITIPTVAVDQLLTLVSVANLTTSCSQMLTATSTVVISGLPTASIASNNGPICSGTDAIFTLTGTANAIVTYNINSAASTTVSLDGAGVGTVTATAVTADQVLTLESVSNAAATCSDVLTATSTVVITALPTATITYAGTPFCSSIATAEAVTLTGTGAYTGGTYSSTAGLTINATTGAITPSTSTAGNYTVTYTIAAAGGCPQVQETTTVDITTLPTATISYAGTPFCSSVATGQAVTLVGTTGGAYSSTAGLSLDALTGAITPSTSTAGNYTVTYTIAAAGGCPQVQETTTVDITTLPTATISYAGTPFCSSVATGQAVTLVGTTGGAYSSTAGLSLDALTGAITPSTSTAGNYTVTYTIAAASGCPQVQETTTVDITTLPTATISYAGAPYCASISTGQTVTLTGQAGGAYSSTAGLTIDGATGAITPNTSTAGNYTVTYTIAAASGCPQVQPTTNISVNALPSITAGTFDVCEVLTIPLTGSGMPDATTPWTSATPSVATIDGSGVVTGVLAGTSLITYMDNNGCVDTATVTVNACTSLTLDQSTLGSSCQNGTISYTITLTNPSAVTSTGIEVMDLIPASNLTFVSATPSQGTYNGITGLWDVGDLASTSSADLTITATATTVGATIINESYVSLENGNTYANYAAADIAMSDSTEVDVYALPTISGTLTVCDGLTTTLSGTNTAHATTPWISATTATATIDNVGEVTAVAAGTSLITYMDDNTCTATATVTVNANPTLSGTLSACETGTTSLSGTNTANLTTPWVSATTAVATIDNAGLVTSVTDGSSLITYMDTNGCIDTATVVINPDPTISGTLTVCDGLTTTLSGTNTAHATTPWVSASTANATIDNVGEVTAAGAGTSLITYMDDNSCTATATVTINANPTLGGTLVACETGTTLLTGTGTPNVTTPWVSATTAAATIDNAGLVTSVSSGTSLITYMDINGCIDTATVTINDMPTITLTSANNTQTFCSTAAGEATIVDITYNLGGSATDVVAVNLPAGVTGTTVGTVYTLSGTATTPGVYNYALATSGQVSPCDSARVSGTITVHPPITATYTNTDVTVPAGSDGTITIVTENGGSGAAIEYELRDSVGTVTVQPYDAPLTGLSSGTYKLFAKNPLESCEYIIDSITIDEPGAIQGDTIVTNVTCKDGTNGSIVAEVTIGGTSPYQYQLERKDGTVLVTYGAALALGTPETFASLSADTFQVRVQDDNGAIVLIKNNIIVHEPDSVQTIIGVVTNATCNAYTDGSIVVSATGGDGSYMYSNDGGSTYQAGTTFSSLGAATYSLMARDANMCVSSVKTQDITDPLVLVLDSVVTNPVCAGVDASAVINATGGSGIYEYSINAGTTWSSSSTISNMTSDLTVDVRDDKGCTSNIFVDVTLVDTIKATLSSTDVTTPGGSDGTISISGITGGNGNAIEYAVYDSIGTTLIQAYDATLVGLPEALYTIRARNVGETCDVKIDTIRVSEPGAIIGVATKVDVDCNGNTTGSITVQVTTGGTPNYELQLESADGLTIISAFGSTAAVAASTPVTFTGLASGSYKIKVRDAVSYECFIAGTIAISQPAALDISASVFTDPDCYNQLGSFEFDIQGGSSPYQYEMNTSGTWLAVTDGVILNSLADGAYSIIVRDDSACTATVTGNILIPDTIKAPIAFTDPLCNGASGSITFGTITGGTGPYAYELDGSGTWKSVSSGASVAGIVASLSPGSSHSILIRDSKACTSLPILGTTTMPSKVQYVKTDIIPLCSTDLGAVVLSTLNGGDNSYEYQLNGGAWISIVQGDTVKNIPNGNYTINIRDGQLCLATPITGIVNVPSPVTTNVFVNSPLCNSGTGWVTISNLTGGTPGYEYLLNNTGLWQSLTDNQVIPNLADGAFTIDIRDANRCPAAQISDAIVIPDSAELALTNGPQNQSVCVGLSITPVVYTYGGGATDATVTGDLHGLIVTKDATAKTVTISGTPTANTNYTVTTVGPDVSCASQIENGGVVINSLPTPTIDGNDNLCAETVGAVYKTQAGMNNYQWTVSSGGLITSGNGSDSIFVTWNTAGQQTVSVNYVDDKGCTAVSSTDYAVTVQAIPNSPLVEDYATCLTKGSVAWSSLVIEATGGNLLWYDEPYGGSSVSPQKVSKQELGEKTMYASVKSKIGCESPRVPVNISVHSIPIASVDQSDIKNIQIEASNGTSPYEYEIYNKTGSFLGSYNVGMLTFGIQELNITDANGCKTKMNFYIDPLPLTPDEFFSPNDDGSNNVWYVKNIEYYPKTVIVIYDRHGKELVKYKGSEFYGWDGKYRGNKMPTTDYWYVIEVKETGQRLVGHFLLKR